MVLPTTLPSREGEEVSCVLTLASPPVNPPPSVVDEDVTSENPINDVLDRRDEAALSMTR